MKGIKAPYRPEFAFSAWSGGYIRHRAICWGTKTYTVTSETIQGIAAEYDTVCLSCGAAIEFYSYGASKKISGGFDIQRLLVAQDGTYRPYRGFNLPYSPEEMDFLNGKGSCP